MLWPGNKGWEGMGGGQREDYRDYDDAEGTGNGCEGQEEEMLPKQQSDKWPWVLSKKLI